MFRIGNLVGSGLWSAELFFDFVGFFLWGGVLGVESMFEMCGNCTWNVCVETAIGMCVLKLYPKYVS